MLQLFRGWKKETARLLVAGLDSSGKTTVLLKLRNGEKRFKEPVPTIPTKDPSHSWWEFKGRRFNVWEVGGQDSIRPLWRHHYVGTQGIVFVIDSDDRDRISEAAQELHNIMKDPAMRDVCLLIFANKADLPHALSSDEVREALRLDALRARAWHVQPSCATSGEGLVQGLKWLAMNVKC